MRSHYTVHVSRTTDAVVRLREPPRRQPSSVAGLWGLALLTFCLVPPSGRLSVQTTQATPGKLNGLVKTILPSSFSLLWLLSLCE